MFKHQRSGPAVTPISDQDARLVAAIQAGDRAAFEQLVSRYDRKLFRIAYNIVHNAADAQNVVQNTFIKVFQNIGRFRSHLTSRIGRPNPEQQYTESELRDLLTRFLQELRPALRVVFIIHDIEGQPLQEVADALYLTLSAVNTRSLRARFHLREQLMVYFKKHVEERVDESRASEARTIAAFA